MLSLSLGACTVKRDQGQVPVPRYDVGYPSAMPPRIEIPIQAAGEHLFLRAAVNGEDNGLFLLDTGSAVNAVSIGIANRLKLPAHGSITVTGIAGQETLRLRRAKSLSIGPLGLDPSRLVGLRTYRLSDDVPLSGIIGFVGLREVPFTIDYGGSRLVIYNPTQFQPPGGATRSRLFLIGKLPGVRATLAPGYSVDLIIDSGDDGAITLPAWLLQRYPEILANPSTGPGRSLGVGGTTANTRAWVKSLTIFGRTLRNVPVTFEMPGSAGGNLATVGRVGNQLLRYFNPTFDLRRQTIWTTWQPVESRIGESQ